MTKKSSKTDRVCVWILPDQLNISISSLHWIDPAKVQIVMIESLEHLSGRPLHKKKVALNLAAMRHLAQKLRALGWNLYYYSEQPNYSEPLLAHLREFKARNLIVMEPSDYDMAQLVHSVPEWTRVALEVRPNNLFLLPRQEFARWFHTHKRHGLPDFYRFMRRYLKLLLTADGKPQGGQWTFQGPGKLPDVVPAQFPPLRRFLPNFTTTEVLEFVRDNFPGHPGELLPFEWPVTKGQAHQWLSDFLPDRLAQYPVWQEAMMTGQELPYRPYLSAALNIGLLEPGEVLHTTLQYYQSHPQRVPLPALEAFLRGLVGVREYLHGLYWVAMPDLRQSNHWKFRRSLPSVYHHGQTDLNCLADVLQRVLRNGHAADAERRWVLANFAVLTEVDPRELAGWFAQLFIDGTEWSALGSLLVAEDGRIGDIPAVAPAQAIQRRSNFCRSCPYDPTQLTGERACPYNFLYWSFLDRHRDRLSGQSGYRAAYRQLDRLDSETRRPINRQAERFLDRARVKT